MFSAVQVTVLRFLGSYTKELILIIDFHKWKVRKMIVHKIAIFSPY